MDECRNLWINSTIPVFDYFVACLEELRITLYNAGEFSIVHQEFFVNSEIISLLTEKTIHEILVLTGIEPLVIYTTSLQEKIKESIQQLAEQFTNNLSILQNQQDTPNKGQLAIVFTMIDQIKQLGRDELVYSKLITGISTYFKETNWAIDSVLSKIKSSDLIHEISSRFGITKTEGYSVTSCSNSILTMIDEMRESLSVPVSLNDFSYLLFLFFTLHSSRKNLCELLHGCRMVCYLVSPEETSFTHFLQELFRCFTLVLLLLHMVDCREK